MEKAITQSPQPTAAQATPADDIEALRRQTQALEKRLDDANARLASARLSERLEKDQQTERLQIIERPTLPQKPLKSGRLKMVGIAFVLAAMFGAGAVFGAEVLDRSISGSHELLGIVDKSLIISIPYIATRSEVLRAKRRRAWGAGILTMALLGGLVAAAIYLSFVDFSWLDTSWLDVLTRPSR